MHIGARIRRIRTERGLTIQQAADLMGFNKGHLSRLERGVKPLNGIKTIATIADALGVSAQELTQLPIPAPGNGGTDSAVDQMRRALSAIEVGQPGGEVVPVEALRARAWEAQRVRYSADFKRLGGLLPSLMRDLHTTIAAGSRDLPDLLDLAVLCHVDLASMWLRDAWAPADLRTRATTVARQLADRRATDDAVAMAAWGATHSLMASGAADLAATVLAAAPLTTIMGLRGAVAHTWGRLAAMRGDDPDPPMDELAELAAHVGEVEPTPLGFALSPTHAGIARMGQALERSQPHITIRLSRDIQPRQHHYVTRQAAYWVDLGRAHALTGQVPQAVSALRQAEEIMPVRVRRSPLVHSAVEALLEQNRDRMLVSLAGRMGISTR